MDGEPDTKYYNRWERSFYIGYLPAIIDYFVAFLFSIAPIIKPSGGKDTPEWWPAFERDCNSGGKRFLDFVMGVFLDTLQVRRAGWIVASPDIRAASMTQAEAEANGIAGAILQPFAAEDILDWDVDATGKYQWVLVRKRDDIRVFPDDRGMATTYTYVDAMQWAVWQETNTEGDDAGFELVGSGEHKLGEIPWVPLEVPHGLWVMNKLAQWQIDLYNKANMLADGQLKSSFLQPYLKSREGQGANNRVFGEGHLLQLRSGSSAGENDEEFGWAVPDVEPLRLNAELLREQRDEGYRTVHQMSLAVDSKAVGAIARSGASKIEDRRATEVILCAYGSVVRDATVRTARLVSRIMRDGLDWECTGFDDFSAPDMADTINWAVQAQVLNVPSPLFKQEMLSDIATGQLIGHKDEETKRKIREQIQQAIVMEEEATAAAAKAGASQTTGIELTPTAQGLVITVNEARSSMGLGPLVLHDGSPDPRGLKTLAEAEAVAAGAAVPAPASAGSKTQLPSVGDDGDSEDGAEHEEHETDGGDMEMPGEMSALVAKHRKQGMSHDAAMEEMGDKKGK